MVKNLPAIFPAWKPGFDPWRTEWPPTLVFFPGEFHEQRSSSWGHKELDTTERLSMHAIRGFPSWLSGKESSCQCRRQVQSLVKEDPLEKEMATHSSILAWEIPWTE